MTDSQNMSHIVIREAQREDTSLVRSVMTEFWGWEPLLVRGLDFFPSELPGFLAFDGEKLLASCFT